MPTATATATTGNGTTGNGTATTGNGAAIPSVIATTTPKNTPTPTPLAYLDVIAKSLSECNTTKKIFFGFFILGFFIIFLSSITKKGAKNNALIYAYAIFIFAILGTVFLDINILKNDNENLLKIITNPLLYTIIVLLWAIVLNSRYHETKPERGVNGHYDKYNDWLNKSTLLICILVGTSLFLEMVQKKDPFIVMYTMVLLIINIIVLVIQQQLLDSFITGG